MGPRSADRGNGVGRPSCTSNFSPLQWGRDQLIAEMQYDTSSTAHRQTLQWGRDQLIAEMRRAFETERADIELQWGRDQLIAEILDEIRE